jgi:hypothetical protein
VKYEEVKCSNAACFKHGCLFHLPALGPTPKAPRSDTEGTTKCNDVHWLLGSESKNSGFEMTSTCLKIPLLKTNSDLPDYSFF